MISLLFQLIAGHAIADYGLQSDWMAKHKDYHVAPAFWFHVLTAHALIHGGTVFVITGSTMLGIAETVLHWIIDYAKCDNLTNLNQDQALHILCKIAWAILLIAFPSLP